MQDKFGNDGKLDPLFLYYMDNIVPKRRLGKTIALPPRAKWRLLTFLTPARPFDALQLYEIVKITFNKKQSNS